MPIATARSESEADLYRQLAALGIVFARHEHEAVFTVAESRELHLELPGVHSKNLFLRDAARRHWLLTIPAELTVNIKLLPAKIGSKRLSFGNADDMRTLLGVAPGSVTPLAAINDLDARVSVVLDRRIADAEIVNVHPLRNTSTLALSGPDLVRALHHWNHPPRVVDINAA
jgi:Ala-tRNA(Pro) deacylase